LDAINRQRRVVGAPALRIDRGLCAVAERATAAYQRLGRGNEKEVDKLLKRDLEGLALTFERTKTAVATIEELRHAPQQLLRAAMDPSMAYAGIVIGPPPPPVAPRGGYSVVLALGR
jgi:3'-phosphoadenosine 5'-phosphosulfate sulfotransferase